MAEKIYVSIDGEQIEATGDLLEEILSNQLAAANEDEIQQLAKQTKLEARAALLERLGITAEEAALLLG